MTKQKEAVESLLDIIGIDEADIKDSVKKYDSLPIKDQINFKTTLRRITDADPGDLNPKLVPIQEQFLGSNIFRILGAGDNGDSFSVEDINTDKKFKFWMKGKQVMGTGVNTGTDYKINGVHDLKNMLLDEA